MSQATKKQRSKQKPRRSSRRVSLPGSFTPRLLDEADQRYHLVREMKRRADALAEECGADSIAKRMLVDEAIYLHLRLETVRSELAQGLPASLDCGQYVQMTNTLKGLLKDLGLERALPKADTFEDYLASRQ